MATLARRQKIANDTLGRIDTVLKEVPEGSLDSKFIPEQLPPLDQSKCPHFPPAKVVVVNSDSFLAAREIIRRSPSAKGKTAVLNLASDELPGGGWLWSLSRTQVRFFLPSNLSRVTTIREVNPRPLGLSLTMEDPNRKKHSAIHQLFTPP